MQIAGMTARWTAAGVVACGMLIGIFVSTNARATQSTAANGAVDGKSLYEKKCAMCHGAMGRGDGPAAFPLDPRPRDFTSGKFKFRTTETGSLPTDDDVARSIRVGLHGTAMPGWEPFLSAADVTAVISYVKSFSPRFRSEQLRQISIANDIAITPDVVAAGKAAYEKLKCAACHGADGKGTGAIAQDLKDDWGNETRSTNLTEPWTFRGGAELRDIYLRFRTGLNGTPMPSFAGAATDKELWTLAAYVRSLARKPVWGMDAAEVAAFYQGQQADAEQHPVERGRYLVTTLGCSYCHTPVREDGSAIEALRLAGGQRWRFEPFGDFVSYNLTSDKETGLGGWTDDQVKTSLTRGVRHDASRMLPFPMPWPAYGNLKATDLNAIIAYLRTVSPVSNRIPAPERPNIVSYLWGKFQLLILKRDMPGYVFPGNAGILGPGGPSLARADVDVTHNVPTGGSR